MTKARRGESAPLFLGIEGGATHTRALMVDALDQVVGAAAVGPANVQLLSDSQLRALLRSLRDVLPQPGAIAIGLAGARTEPDRERIRRASARIWPGTPCYATNDLETALMAASPAPKIHQRARRPSQTRVLVLSGTGSCCFGQSPKGQAVKTGGWGHLLGDRGSAYDIGLRGLRGVLHHFDRVGRMTPLGLRLLRKLQSESPEEWVGWIQQADKTAIAALAVEVFAVCPRDPIARNIVTRAAFDLAEDALACAEHLAGARHPVDFILAGGVLLKQSHYARLVRRQIISSRPASVVRPLTRESVWGAVELARLQRPGPGPAVRVSRRRVGRGMSDPTTFSTQRIPCPDLESLQLSPTERRNSRSLRLSEIPVGRAIDLMLREDRRILPALLDERPKLERAISWIVSAFRRGGRLLYVGAGTSGRLGVLDASECPPTFRTPPDQVQGIMAGGRNALWESVEGAEDNPQAGAEAIRLRRASVRDVVVGIAASGRTPYVWGALWEAHRCGAKTVLLCFNPQLKVPRGNRPGLIIAPDIGPEVLTGSTRLKSGTATKLILNLFTTLAMVRLGKVIGNLMVDLNPSNVKLRGRAVRIVRQLTAVSEAEALTALEASGWVVKEAIRRLGIKPR